MVADPSFTASRTNHSRFILMMARTSSACLTLFDVITDEQGQTSIPGTAVLLLHKLSAQTGGLAFVCGVYGWIGAGGRVSSGGQCVGFFLISLQPTWSLKSN